MRQELPYVKNPENLSEPFNLWSFSSLSFPKPFPVHETRGETVCPLLVFISIILARAVNRKLQDIYKLKQNRVYLYCSNFIRISRPARDRNLNVSQLGIKHPGSIFTYSRERGPVCSSLSNPAQTWNKVSDMPSPSA